MSEENEVLRGLDGAGVRRHLATALGLFDALSLGILITDRDAKLVYANGTAEAFLHRRDGLLIQAGRLKALRVSDARHLHRCIERGAGAVQVNKAEGRPYLTQVMTPAGDHGEVVLLVSDMEDGHLPDAEAVSKLLHLTKGEGRAVSCIAAGWSAQEVANHLGVGLTTVRTHVRSALHKVGCNRTSALISMVLRSPVAWTRRLSELPADDDAEVDTGG